MTPELSRLIASLKSSYKTMPPEIQWRYLASLRRASETWEPGLERVACRIAAREIMEDFSLARESSNDRPSASVAIVRRSSGGAA